MVILTFATVSKPCPAIVQRAYNHFTFSMVSVSSLVCFDLFVLPLHTTKLLNGENDKRPVDASGHPPDINTDDQTCIANLLTQASKCLKWWGVMAGSSGHVWWGSRIWSSPSTSWTFLQHSLLDTMVAHTHTHNFTCMNPAGQIQRRWRGKVVSTFNICSLSWMHKGLRCHEDHWSTWPMSCKSVVPRIPAPQRIWFGTPYMQTLHTTQWNCSLSASPWFLNKNNHRPGKPPSLMQPWMIAISYQLPGCVFQA